MQPTKHDSHELVDTDTDGETGPDFQAAATLPQASDATSEALDSALKDVTPRLVHWSPSTETTPLVGSTKTAFL